MPPKAFSRLTRIAALALAFLSINPFGYTTDLTPLGETYLLKIWNNKDGLSNRIVNATTQDSEGYIWLATIGGLIRFDGTNYRKFNVPQNHRPRGDNIRTLVSGPEGKILFQPTSGMILQRQDGKISEHPASAAIGQERAREMFQSPDGTLWINTESGSILRWTADESEWIETLPENTTEQPTIRNASFAWNEERTWINTSNTFGNYADGKWTTIDLGIPKPILICQANSGGLLLFTESSLFIYRDGELTALSSDVPWSQSPGELYKAVYDDHGTLWIAAGKLGLLHWKEGTFHRAPEDFPFVNDLAKDKSGNIWASSYGNGLAKVTRRFTTLLNRSDGLRTEISSSIHRAQDGTMWIANGEGGVYHVIDDKPKSIELFYDGERLPANTLTSDKNGRLWIGNSSGLFVSEFPYQSIRKIEEIQGNVHLLHHSSDDRIWFATNFGRFGDSNTPASFGYLRRDEIFLFDQQAGYNGKPIHSIAEAPDGTVWVGTYSGSLLRANKQKIERVLENSAIPDLHFDQQGRLWITTITETLIYGKDRVLSLEEDTGYQEKGIPAVHEDRKGNIWLGLNRFPIEEIVEKARNRTPAPIPSNFNRITSNLDLSMLVDAHPFSQIDELGRLWFATSKGILIFDPSALPDTPRNSLVNIDSVYVNNSKVNLDTEPLDIPPGPHNIRIDFSSPNLSDTSRRYLRYRLLGAGKEWSDASYLRLITYSALAPGNYRLELQAGSPSGWSAPATTFSFQVLPPWWQTVWFRVLGLSTAIAIAAAFIWIWTQRRMQAQLAKLEQDQALERERARIARDLHDDLGGGLSALQLFASRLAEEPEDRRTASLAQLAERARRLNADVHSIVWLFKPSEGTVQELAELIEQYAAEIFKGSSVECRLSDPGILPPATLTPEAQHNLFFAAKEALTNSLKHANATKISVELNYNDPILTCTIKDNGIGLPAPAEQQRRKNGLINMQARMREIGGQIDFRSDQEIGTQITITYSLLPPSHDH